MIFKRNPLRFQATGMDSNGAQVGVHTQAGNNIIVFVPIVFLALLCGVELGAILLMNNGLLVYSLDDPYIHLALAEHIREGHYGINAAEYSAPSSSVLWPLLLVPFVKLSFADYVPLVINIAASMGTVFLLHYLMTRFVLADAAVYSYRYALLLSALVIGLNLVTLTFTGMEHSVQVFLALLAVAGVITERETGAVPWWLIAAVIAGPLVRYENLALSLPTLAWFVWRKHYTVALVTALATLLPLVLFSVFLNSVGLGFFPSSVVAKSDAVASGGRLLPFIKSMVENALAGLNYFRQGFVLLFGLLLLLVPLSDAKRPVEDRVLAAWAIAAIIFHLLLGRFGWFARYEVYVMASTLGMVIYLYRRPVQALLAQVNAVMFAVFVSAAVIIIGFPYVYSTLRTPLAANNIYEQQYQMHRFVRDYYPEPVAVNDLGWVSYRNHNYVLDFWGLGSIDALHARKSGQDGEWMDRLAKKHGVNLAMIYDPWFPQKPGAWIPMGQLLLGKKKMTPAEDAVTFYALNAESADAIRSALVEFQKQLPPGVSFVFSK